MNKFLGFVLATSAAISGCGGNKDFQARLYKTSESTDYAGKPSPQNCRMYETKIRRQVDNIVPRHINSQGDLDGISYDEKSDACIFTITTVINQVKEDVKRSFFYNEKNDTSSEIKTSKLARNNHTNTGTKKGNS